MSVDDVVRIKSAYEKMLEDGSAFEKVDMSMLTEPSLEAASSGLGDKVNTEAKHPSLVEEQPHTGLETDNTDFSDIDRRMSERMNSLRNKTSGGDSQREILALKKRVKRLEEALMLVMETQEKLIK